MVFRSFLMHAPNRKSKGQSEIPVAFRDEAEEKSESMPQKLVVKRGASLGLSNESTPPAGIADVFRFMPTDIKSLAREELEAQFKNWEQPVYRVTQVLEWLYARHVTNWDR